MLFASFLKSYEMLEGNISLNGVNTSSDVQTFASFRGSPLRAFSWWFVRDLALGPGVYWAYTARLVYKPAFVVMFALIPVRLTDDCCYFLALRPTAEVSSRDFLLFKDFLTTLLAVSNKLSSAPCSSYVVNSQFVMPFFVTSSLSSLSPSSISR